jgi:hypothetical protein
MRKVKTKDIIPAAKTYSSTPVIRAPANLMNRVAEICSANNCDPFEILCRIAMGDNDYLGLRDSTKPISMKVRMEAASTLCPYLAPTFKNAEIKEEGRTVNINFNMGAPPK